MPNVGFGGTAVTGSFSEGWVYSSAYIDPGRTVANGTTPVVITALYGYVAGRGATRSVTMTLGGAAVGFSVGAGGSASGVGYYSTNYWLTNGGSYTFRYDFSGSTYFARGANGTGSTVGAYGSYTGSLGGAYSYIQAPTAPTGLTLASGTGGQLSVSWTAPSDNGGTAITGYQVQAALNAGFTTGLVTADVTGTSTTLTGLVPGATYYVRVAAKNYVTTTAGTVSAWSAASTVYVVGGFYVGQAGVWKDAQLFAGINGAWVPVILKVGRSGAWTDLSD